MNLNPSELKRALSKPLPGYSNFPIISGYERPTLEEMINVEPPLQQSAVLILIHPRAGQDHTLLIRRSTYPGVHSGQIAFPGGKREAVDKDLTQTALREFREETGAKPEAIEIMGTLSRIPIPPSRMLVTPVVAWAPTLGPVNPDEREVAALLDVPLAELLRNDILRRKPIPMGTDGQPRLAAYWDLHGEVVWGATALMIAELRAALGVPFPPLG